MSKTLVFYQIPLGFTLLESCHHPHHPEFDDVAVRLLPLTRAPSLAQFGAIPLCAQIVEAATKMPYGKSNPKKGQASLGKALQRRRAHERAAADRYLVACR